ncbi:hypothetical protein EV363DRAFT_1377362 [Boletus edulis]|nr:hypothetical protein EV363DRAFT_1377362 [Boletus edulis]
MASHGCWTTEYDWMVSLGSEPQSRETVLCVLFEDGAPSPSQRQFSSVRTITLLYSSDTTPQHHHTWQIKPCSPPLSVVSRVPFESQLCNIVFTADRHSTRSQTISGVAKDCGELVLTETGPPKDFHNIMFEFDQPLTENTESVSVSFTSSRLLCTMITHGVFSDPPSDHSTTVGRVVRVFPVEPTSKRKTISLPTDVLFLIFENLRFPPTYRGWRKDVLSSALVCREWTCALTALLADFRSEESQQGYPPEICRFASGLVARPSLGLGIKYLSVGYLEKHPSWDPLPDFPHPGRLSAMFLAKLQLRQGNPRRSQFGKALLSILSVAKNIQTLRLYSGMDLVVASDDLADTLCGLNKLETFEGRCPLTMAQLVSCVATWPSLKRLSIVNVLPPVDHTLLLASPSYCLTRISRLTNAGLGAALNAVCTSLTYLYIMSDALLRSPGEEHALDATITRMERLTMLKIVPNVASERMVE